MVDIGLFISVGLTAVAVYLASRLFAAGDIGERSVSDQFTAPLVAGVVVGRAVTLLLSDPAGLTSLREFMTVRGGIEFWPAVLAAIVVLTTLFSRPTDPDQPARVARLLPYAIVGLGVFQGACLVRDGCPGPSSSIGLVPGGLTSRQLPIGLLGGIALVVFAWWLRRSQLPNHTKILVAVVGVGIERTVAGIAEPSLESAVARDGLFMVAAFSIAIGWWAWFVRQERQWQVPHRPHAEHR